MPTGPSLQVAPGWYPELQPGADHAECCGTQEQQGCQHHEGEAHLLRCVVHSGAEAAASADVHAYSHLGKGTGERKPIWLNPHPSTRAHTHRHTSHAQPSAAYPRVASVVGRVSGQGQVRGACFEAHPAYPAHTQTPQVFISTPLHCQSLMA